tara:strand:- start:73 stop:669 length:597 start_codon:yes stop_codon:yes gene_type:complete
MNIDLAEHIQNEKALTVKKFDQENPGLIDALRETTSWNSFAASLVSQYESRGTLTEKQTGAAVAMLMKIKAKKAERDAAPQIDLSNIVEMFNKAHEAIKTPKFRYDDLVISRAPDSGVNAGALYVKVNGEYAGKVKEGKWFGSQDVLAKLKEIAENPLESAVAYGRKTGNCSMCGRLLTNHGSIDRGIGPICAERFGL